MKIQAMALERHGGPEVLERTSIELAPPGPRQVRVKVCAVAMNHLDIWVRRGLPHLKHTYPHRLGSDIAGVVDQLGPGASHTAVGQRVIVQPGVACGVCSACLRGADNLCSHYAILGENTQGGYAEYVNVPDANLIPMPDHLDFVEAAALPLCTLTAWQAMVRKACVMPGNDVLIQAAGSGVSSIAIQIAKLVGARVIATVGSQEKVKPAHELGVDELVVGQQDDLVRVCKRFTDGRGVDVALDHVGGKMFEQVLRATAWGGKVVTVGATAGHATNIDLRQVFFRQVQILGSTMGSKGDLLAAVPLITRKKIRPVVGAVMSLWDAPKGHELLESRKVFGKVVFRVAD